jgi:hypothetical protein
MACCTDAFADAFADATATTTCPEAGTDAGIAKVWIYSGNHVWIYLQKKSKSTVVPF